jgi:hypothetical protein
MNSLEATESYASDHVAELVAKARAGGYAAISDEIRATYGTGSYLDQLPSGYWYIGCSL